VIAATGERETTMFLSRVELVYLTGAAAFSAILLVAPSYAAQRPKLDVPTAKQVSVQAAPISAEASRTVRVVYPNPYAGR
jgi:hypothetical protein